MLEFHDKLELLNRVWADCGLFGHSLREGMAELVLEMMVNNPKPDLAVPFAEIASDIKNRILNQPEDRDRKLALTGQLVGLLSSVFIRSGDVNGAWDIFSKYDYLIKKILGSKDINFSPDF